MMMCCFRLSPLPHSSDVLGIVSTCLPVATLSLFGLHTLSGMDYRTPTQWRIQTSSRAAGPSLIQRLCGQLWKIIPRTKTAEVLPLSPPPVDRNLRSRQECARALPRVMSEQISIRRQVWSAYPHSCSCLRSYYYVQEPFTMWHVVKLECWHNKTLRKVCPRTLFNNTSWGTLAVVRVVLCFLYRNSPLLIWFQNSTSFAFGTRESLSTLWVPFLLLFEREEWDHCGPKAQSVRFRWLFR